MGWIGADLAALDGLARRFVTTSEECQRHAGAVVRSATTTVEHFTTAMADLEREAESLSAEIGTSVTTLRNQAVATTWTGANRARQDELLARYEADVATIRTSIAGFVADAAGLVAGGLNPTIEAMRSDIERAGATAAAAADGFARSVERQRRSFDAVLNGVS